MQKESKQYLEQYLQTLTDVERASITQTSAEQFCADEYNTNECARLVNIGQKKATCSLKEAWLIEKEPLPIVGRLTVVLDWQETPVCIIKVIDVTLRPFNQVPVEFAEAEGEGDGTYEWWHKAHVKFFSEYAKSIGINFDDESLLVLERFEKVYPLT